MGRRNLARWLLFARLAIAAALCFQPAAAGNAAGGVLIVVSSRAEAYELALDSLIRELKSAGLTVTVAHTEDARQDVLRPNDQRPIKGVVALGPEAISKALQFSVDVPIVAGMVLRSTVAGFHGGGGRLAAAAVVDVPFEVLIQHLRRVYPQVARIGVIRNPSRPDPAATEFEAIGRQYGLTVAVADAAGPQSLAAAYSTLARSSEAVICFPDASLYNSTTIEALISASLRAKAPIVGFSEGFVRAGALFSVYPDYEVVGRQTAAALIAAVAGHDARSEWPVKTYKSAENSRVARLVNFRRDSSASGSLKVIQ